MIAADCLSNRFSAFCLHLWHRVTYFTIQHQLVPTAALLSIIQKGLRSVLEMCVTILIWWNLSTTKFLLVYVFVFQDGSEQPMESLSLIDAVMPDVVASRQQQTQNNQKPQVVKTEPPNSNGDEPMHSYRKIVNTFLWSPELLTYFPFNYLMKAGKRKQE